MNHEVCPSKRNQAIVSGLACLLAVAGVVLVVVTPDVEVAGVLPVSVALISVAALYILADLVTLNFEVGRHGLAVTISDVPLILGIFLLPSELLVAACLVGALTGWLARRSPGVKALLNLGLNVAEIGLATWMLHRLSGSVVSLAESGWWIVFAIILTVNLLGVAAVLASLTILEGPPPAAELSTMVVTVVVSGAFSSAVSLICLLVLDDGNAALALLLVVAAMMALMYRSYSAVIRRHADLDQLMTATSTLSRSHGENRLTETLARESHALVGAQDARLIPADDAGALALLGPADDLVINRDTREPAKREWLRHTGHRDAILIRVGEDTALGILAITDRVGTSSSFSTDDLARVRMLVRHAEALWANGLLSQRLHFDSTHDSLTGLANRQHLLSTMTQRLASLAVSSGPISPDYCDAALLLLDLDGFKEINDTLGHPTGDSLLMLTADRLQNLAPDQSLVARIGGDEFAVLLPAASVEDVKLTAERLQQGIREAVILEDTRVEVDSAIGLSLVPQDGTDASTVLRRADVARYAAKTTGRITRHHVGLDTATVDRLEILGDLRRSLDDGGVRPWFQPKIHLSTGMVVGFEALARWEHPARGMVYPDEFVPLAERGGLATPLTATMLARSLVECQQWQSRGYDVGVAVNVPARQLEENDFAIMVTRVLEETGVMPGQLTLEITEGAAVPSHLEALRSLSELRELGVRIAVDDFGTGYSALGYLHRLPVDEVKIDKSFVLPMQQEKDSAAIVRTIVDLSRDLGIQTVAEGVEDPGTADQLREMGCTIAQGFLVSRPIPAHRVPGWLAEYSGTPLRRVEPV